MTNKFVINKVIIEKSEKDIVVNKEYIFSDSFNLIYGNNETGKSSLMNFLKGGFFYLENKRTEKGKIFFNLENNFYHAEINNDKKLPIFFESTNNSKIENPLTNKLNKKYFEEGFTMNLEDLNFSSQNSSNKFISTIKDPSTPLFTEYLENLSSKINSVLGKSGKLVQTTQTLNKEINEINNQIKQVSSYEQQYSRLIDDIKLQQEQINNLENKKEYLKQLKDIRLLEEKVINLKKELQEKLINYNEKLNNNKIEYDKLLEKIGKYDIESENSFSVEIKSITEKINNIFSILKSKFGIILTEETIKKTTIDWNKNNTIKKLKEEIDTISKELFTNEQKLILEEAENKRFEKNKETLKKELKTNCSVEELEEIKRFLTEKLGEYNLLSSKLANITQTEMNKTTFLSKSLSFYFIIIFAILNLIYMLYAISLKDYSSGFYACTIAIFSIILVILHKLQNNYTKEKTVLNREIQNILSLLKEKCKAYITDIENCIDYVLYSKLENFKINIENELKIYNQINEQEQEISNKKNIISILNNDILSSKEKIFILNKQIKDNAEKEIFINSKSINDYLEVINILDNTKELIYSREKLTDELISLKERNQQIWNEIKTFINEYEINILADSNFKNTITELKNYVQKNIEKSFVIKELTTQINYIEIEQKEKKGNLEKYKKLIDIAPTNFNINIMEEEIEQQKKQIQANKEHNLSKKGMLENYEELEKLKLKQIEKINLLRETIKKLYLNKLTLSLLEQAKQNFNKTQPSLVSAEKYLSILTNGKYNRIDIDTQMIANDNEIKSWNNLSRGTKEQLYFSLRLGYASNYSKDKHSNEENGKPDLPLIIDDIFVNFDLSRTKNAIKCLLEFSKTNQILFFTCHESKIKELISQIQKEQNNTDIAEINEIQIQPKN